MTIQIEIRNTDDRETAVVEVSETQYGRTGMQKILLRGGEVIRKLVHGDQQIVVKEIQNG